MPWISSSQRTGPNCCGLSVRRRQRGDAAEVRVDAALAGRPRGSGRPGPGRAGRSGASAVGPRFEDVERRDSPGRLVGIHDPEEPAALEVEVAQPGGPAPGWWSGRRCRSARRPRCPSGWRPGSGAGPGPTSKVALTPKLLAGTAAVMKRDGGGWNMTVPTSIRRTISSSQSLVVDLDVVVGGEVALGVVVHVDVDPLPQQAARPEVDLVVEARRLEAAPAAGVGVEGQGRGAALVPHAGRSGSPAGPGRRASGRRTWSERPSRSPARRGAPRRASLRSRAAAVEVSSRSATRRLSRGRTASAARDGAVARRDAERRRRRRGAAQPGGAERGRAAGASNGGLVRSGAGARARSCPPGATEHPGQPGGGSPGRRGSASL